MFDARCLMFDLGGPRRSRRAKGQPHSHGRQPATDLPARAPQPRRRSRGFTLTELLVTMGVLVVLVLLFTQLLNSAATTMTLGNKRMDADSQARQLLDRMAIDFDQMLKRTDVSYYVKTTGNTQTGNDQIAFFSAVPGYYSQAGYNSNASLVAYRVNADSTSASYNKLERMGKGLRFERSLYNRPRFHFCFLMVPAIQRYRAPGLPLPAARLRIQTTKRPGRRCFGLNTIICSAAVSLPRNQLSPGPWASIDTFSVKDVAAIVVAIAVIEPKSRVLLSNDQVAAIAATLPDFTIIRLLASCLRNGKPLSMQYTWLAAPGHFRYSAVRTLFLS